MNLYKPLSIVKIILWIGILMVDYTTINIYEDPTIAIGLGLLWSFLLSRGACFFCCLGIQKVFKKTLQTEEEIKKNYYLSLFFAFYCVFNIIVLLYGNRNKIRGVVLLVIFILLQHVVLSDKGKHEQWKGTKIWA